MKVVLFLNLIERETCVTAILYFITYLTCFQCNVTITNSKRPGSVRAEKSTDENNLMFVVIKILMKLVPEMF